MKKRFTLTLLLALLLALPTACTPSTPAAPTPDVNAVSTAAAQTVMANIANTLAAASPTFEPTAIPSATLAPPTDTATATVINLSITVGPGTKAPSCDVYTFISDENYPDNSEVTAGQEFVKTWKIQNTSPCTWAGYKIVYGGYADKMGGVAQPLPGLISPGEVISVSVQFKAPTKAGAYVSAWTLANALGISFFDNNGKPFYVKIVVR